MTAPGYPTAEQRTLDIPPCPAPEVLLQFLNLALPVSENLTVRSHVEVCLACQRQLDALTEIPNLEPPLKVIEGKPIESLVPRLVRLLCDELSLPHNECQIPPAPIPLEHRSSSHQLGHLDRFLIRREIASGATATVFEAIDTVTDSPVAIKFLRGADSQTLRRARREAEAIRRIDHPQVISLNAVEVAADGRVYLVMPLLPGRPLSDYIAEHAYHSPRPWVELILQIADGLAAVHHEELLHRDIKPANILVDDDGRARLTDFGLAAFQDEASSLTGTDVILGTPVYMSPEQAAGQKDLDARADIYSLGATLYECVTGNKPFRGHPQQVIRQIFEREPLRPRVIDETIPPALEAVILKSMNKSRAARYANVEAFAEDLRRWLAGKRVNARLPSRLQLLWNWVKRERRLATSLAATVLAIGLAVWMAWSYWSTHRERQRLALHNYESALNSVFTLADLAESSLDGDPGSLPMRTQLRQSAEKYFSQFAEFQPQRHEQLNRHLSAINRLARLKMILDGPQTAVEFLMESIAGQDGKWVVAASRDKELQRTWIQLHLCLAEAQLELKRLPEASATLEDARMQMLDGPEKDSLLLAEYHRLCGAMAFQQLQFVTALQQFETAQRLIRSQLATIDSAEPVEVDLARLQNAIANCHLNLGNLNAARENFEILNRFWKSKVTPDLRYVDRLDSLRAAVNLVSVLVRQNQQEDALRLAQEIRPELEQLQASNPTLMMPFVLDLGLFHDEIACQILHGQFETAIAQSQLAVDRATELVIRFPKELRSNFVRVQARFQHFVCLLHLADYQQIERLLKDWIVELEQEDQPSLAKEQTQVLR
ncbi:MAG TPA: serine/threonine-protein kinase [Pirellulaceae bacterium]|nr:serine/threonine-protein kinase [Pirellulaceae bacterium]HMP69242.1 serine/threonine-protein kinase [Pirellulaceae bacterium]